MLDYALAHLGQARALAHGSYRVPLADLDDVVQDALADILASRTDWSRIEDPEGYWLTCVANEARMYWTRRRGRRRRQEAPLPEGGLERRAPASEEPEGLAIAAEMLQQLVRACTPSEAATLRWALAGQTRRMSSGERVRLLRLRRRARAVWGLR